MWIELSNVRKKKSEETAQCEKRIVTCDVRIAHVRVKPSNVRKK